MRSFPHPKDVPGLEAVEQALRRAVAVAASGPVFRVCVCSAQEEIVAVASVEGFDQLKRFSREMARHGYAARILGQAGIGCDVNYTPRAGARDIFDDGEPLTGPAPLE